MPVHLLTASGAASSTGDAAAIELANQHLTSSGSAVSGGDASIANELPLGGLTDFGIWSITQPDTAMTRDVSHNQIFNDATTTRIWLAATAPTAYAPAGGSPLWNGAVYAGIGIKWLSLPTGDKHSFDNVQFEQNNLGNRLSWAATSWQGRTCYIGQASVNYATVQSSTDTALTGTTSGKITYTGAPANSWGYWINPTTPTGMTPCTPNEVLNASVSLSMQRKAWWSAGLQFYDVNYNPLPGVGQWYTNGYQQHPGGGNWDTSYVYNITVPANAVWVAVVPHISINSTPSASDSIAPVGEVAYTDAHRIWSRPYNLLYGTPSTYATPGKLSIDVLANRINLVNNPSFANDIWGWGAYGNGSAPYPASQDGSTGRVTNGALKFSVPANVATYSGVSTTMGPSLLTGWSTSDIGGFGWQPNTTYTASLYVKPGPGTPNITLLVGPAGEPNDYTPTAGVLTTNDALNHPELIDENGWIRLWATFTTASNDSGLVDIWLSINSSDVTRGGVGVTFWVDDVLCEEGNQLLDYFDGSSPSADYLWAGTPWRSSSHYYQGFRSNNYRLNDIVKSVAPHGSQYQILLAQPPS